MKTNCAECGCEKKWHSEYGNKQCTILSCTQKEKCHGYVPIEIS